MEQPVTLFVGADSESAEAVRVIQGSGVTTHIVDDTLGGRDFETPLLVTSWGVFEGLNAIVWFTKVAEEDSGTSNVVDETIS